MLTVNCFNPRNLINLLRLTSRKSNPIRHDQCVRNRWDRLQNKEIPKQLQFRDGISQIYLFGWSQQSESDDILHL